MARPESAATRAAAVDDADGLRSRHRPRGPRPAAHAVEDLLRLLGDVRRAAERRTPARSASACRACCRCSTARVVEFAIKRRAGDRLHDRARSAAGRARTTSIPICPRAIRSPSTSCRSAAAAGSTSSSTASRKRGAPHPHPHGGGRRQEHPRRSTATRAWSTSTAPACRWSRSSASPTCARAPRPAPTCASCARSSSTSGSATATWRRAASAATPTSRCARAAPTELGTKAELKNMNSFRAVERAIDYEIARQIELLQRGERVVQETRLWDADREETRSMRSQGGGARLPLLPRARPAAAGGRRGVGGGAARRACPSCPTRAASASRASTGCPPTTPRC